MTNTHIDNSAVCLYFDTETESVVRCAWKYIAEAGFSSEMPDVGWRPHITLSGCRGIDVEAYLPILEEFAAHTYPMEIMLASIGCFGVNSSPLFLAPTITKALLDMHERHHGLVIPYCASVSPYYIPGSWTPHCTLALNLSTEQIVGSLLELSKWKLPSAAILTGISVVRVARPFVEELVFFPLGG